VVHVVVGEMEPDEVAEEAASPDRAAASAEEAV